MKDGEDRDIPSEVERLGEESVTKTIAQPSAPALSAGEMLAGRFKILKFLGRGGMGEVYQASDAELGGTVALKVLRSEVLGSPSSLARFRREVQTARQVTHPNVCRVFDVGFHTDGSTVTTFLTMEYLDGVTLSQRLQRSGALTTGEALLLLRQIANGLDSLHEKGIVHRDLKPGNVMIVPGKSEGTSRAVITDFGLARGAAEQSAGAEAEPQSGPTRMGQVIGTPAYMSPEQLRGELVTSATDIYALGLMIREMVTGNRKSSAAAGDGTKIPKAWEQTWRRCLDADPANRPASASEAVNELTGGQLATGSMKRWVVSTLAASAGIVLAIFGIGRMGWFHTAPTAATRHQVAVLAFTAPGQSAEMAVFADGLMEDITGRLSQFEGPNAHLLIVPASVVRQQAAKTPEDAKAKFSADEVVQGSLQSQGDRVRLRLTVIDTHQMRQTSTVMVEDQRSNALSLEDAAVAKLAAALNLRMLPDQSKEIVANVAPGAYEYYLQARGYLQRGDKLTALESAISLFNKVLEVDTKSASAYAGLAEAYQANYNLTRDSRWMDEAIKSCNRALSLNSSLPDAHIILGRIHLDGGKFEEARGDFETALKADPRDSRGYQGMASAYEGLKEYAKAETTYRKAIALRPDDWNGYRRLGLFYYNRDKLDEAIVQFQQVVALTPDNAQGYTNLGAFQILKGATEAARKNLERALELDPTRASTVANLAKLYFDNGEYPKAVELYSRAAKLNPNDFRGRGSLGVSYKRAGDEANAKVSLDEAIRLVDGELKVNAKRAELYSYKALYLSTIGTGGDIEALLKRARELAPDDANIQVREAETQANLGNNAEAIRVLRKLQAKGYPMARLEVSVPLRPLLPTVINP